MSWIFQTGDSLATHMHSLHLMAREGDSEFANYVFDLEQAASDLEHNQISQIGVLSTPKKQVDEAEAQVSELTGTPWSVTQRPENEYRLLASVLADVVGAIGDHVTSRDFELQDLAAALGNTSPRGQSMQACIEAAGDLHEITESIAAAMGGDLYGADVTAVTVREWIAATEKSIAGRAGDAEAKE